MYIIKNGHVIDPANQFNGIADVTIDGDKIVSVGPADESAISPSNVIDASGCYVTPGLIDHHCHMWPFVKIGLPVQTLAFTSGVTTAVDAGSNGCATYPKNHSFIENEKLGIKAYLHVCSTGLSTLPDSLEDVNPEHWDEGAIRDCFESYPGELLGLKLRTSAPIVKEWGYLPLKKTVEMADRLGVSVMVHCTDPPGEMDELVDMLRPGDFMTHMYMNIGPGILDEKGLVKKSVLRARERGVLFEAADARAHMGFNVSAPAIAQGFLPDVLATDITALSMNLRPTTFNLATQLARYHALGIPFEKLIELTTAAPARFIGEADRIGALTPGFAADVAVFREEHGCFVSGDRTFDNKALHTINMDTIYRPLLTIKNGQLVYRDIAF